MKARATIEIQKPIEEVFAFVADVESMPKWMSGVRSARLESGDMGPDARFVLGYDSGWRPFDVQVAVAEYTPPAALGLIAERGPFGFEGRIELEALPEGPTRVTSIIEAGPDSLSTKIAAVVLGPFLKGSMNRRLLRELEALRRSIEGEHRLQA